jgi:hypothetical protein
VLWKNNTKGTLFKSQQKHVIQVTTEKDDSAYPWKPICRILDGASRELIKQIDWQIGYDTPDQAEKAGMLISKKWIHAKKPKL